MELTFCVRKLSTVITLFPAHSGARWLIMFLLKAAWVQVLELWLLFSTSRWCWWGERSYCSVSTVNMHRERRHTYNVLLERFLYRLDGRDARTHSRWGIKNVKRLLSVSRGLCNAHTHTRTHKKDTTTVTKGVDRLFGYVQATLSSGCPHNSTGSLSEKCFSVLEKNKNDFFPFQ